MIHLPTLSATQIPPPSPTSPSTVQALPRNWPAGQLFSGTTLSPQNHGAVLVNIGGTRVVAHASLALQAGQTLQLQVIQNGELPILKILDRLPAGNPSTDAMRFALPRQGGLPPLLANLSLLSQIQGQNLPGLNTRLTTLGEQIVNQLAQVQGTSQNLAQGFKAGLLRLHESLLSGREQLPMVEIKTTNQFFQQANPH